VRGGAPSAIAAGSPGAAALRPLSLASVVSGPLSMTHAHFFARIAKCPSPPVTADRRRTVSCRRLISNGHRGETLAKDPLFTAAGARTTRPWTTQRRLSQP
jgi:hypothetical protein